MPRCSLAVDRRPESFARYVSGFGAARLDLLLSRFWLVVDKSVSPSLALLDRRHGDVWFRRVARRIKVRFQATYRRYIETTA